MRTPIVTSLQTRLDDLTKDARVTNGIIEVSGEQTAVRKRPGALDLGLISGAGQAQALMCWDGQLRSVVGNLALEMAIYEVTPAQFTDTLYPDWALWSTQIYELAAHNYLLVGLDGAASEMTVGYIFNSLTQTFTPVSGFQDGLDPSHIAVGNGAIVVSLANWSGLGLDWFGEMYRATTAAPTSFTPTYQSASSVVTRVRFLGGKFVALTDTGTSGRVRWSTDGITWSSKTVTQRVLRDMMYDGTTWWFWGWYSDGVTTTAYCVTTTDFVTFTDQVFTGIGKTGEEVRSCVFHSGTYWVYTRANDVLTLYKSTDGLTFSVDLTASIAAGDMLTLVYTAAGEAYLSHLHATYPATGVLYALTSVRTAVNTYDAVAAELAVFSGTACVSDAVDELVLLGEPKLRTYWLNNPVTPYEEVAAIETLPVPLAALNTLLSVGASGAAQSNQQLLLKSADQLFIYTKG